MAKLDYTNGIELLDGARSVAVCGHVNPDGDCLGSALAVFTAEIKAKRPGGNSSNKDQHHGQNW